MSDFITDFLNGQSDCEKGVEHKPGQSDAYDRGYAAAYEFSAVKDEITQQENKRVNHRAA